MLNLNIQNHKPLREIVYDELREGILTGAIKPGTRMMEVDLAEEMGVSRTPVREAIRKLEKEGLVTIRPRKGAYASDISVKSMMDILEVRSNLEGLAAELAARRMPEEKKKELIKIEAAFEKALSDGDMKEMIHMDTLFHHFIVEGSENNHLILLVEQLQELVLRFRYIYYKDFKRAGEMAPEHRDIYEAIINNAPDAARDSAFNHIDRLKDMIVKDDLK
ncbi:MAG: GntR family transcriptional regulator [Eubacteriales bacterium]|nr:GntR family transcriptional regulator [Eubacteriales bacterium]MDD3350106.1 GntR family transcriptional regulator [Eubacteriales bacterium]